MAFNLFKKNQPADAEAESDAVAEAPPQAAGTGADDATDPLGSAPQQRVEPLREGHGVRLERVEVWGAERLADTYVRLSVTDAARADTFRDLLLNLPEASSGFRDLLVSDAAPLAAALDPAPHTLADVHAMPFYRALDVLEAMGDIAALLAQVRQRTGWVWSAPTAQAIGLSAESAFPATGYTRLRASFMGWDALVEGDANDEAASVRALAALCGEALDDLSVRAAQADFSHGHVEMAQIWQWVADDLAVTAETYAGLEQSARRLCQVRLQTWAATDTGRKRQHNEDAYALLSLEQASAAGLHLTLVAVADGMGGHNSGEIASSLALDLLRQQATGLLAPPGMRPPDTAQLVDQLAGIVPAIGRALNDRAALEPNLGGMGTTLVGFAALRPLTTLSEDSAPALPPPAAALFWVGDSRAYLLSAAGLHPLSIDHSYVQGLLQSGQIDAAEAFSHPQKNIITRCLGASGQDDRPEVASFTPGPGEIVLLCSDGLSDALRDEDIWRVACENSESVNLAGLGAALIDAANAAGGPDNITLALIAS